MSRDLVIVVGSLLVLSAWPVLTMPVNATYPAASFRPQGVNNYQGASAVLTFPAEASDLNLTCRFPVPQKPPAWDGSTQVYLWCGLNWYDRNGLCLGVMQPVLTYGCSPDAMSGIGCGGNGSDPHYSRDPYWYFSSQYVLGWAPGQARGSSEVIRTEPGRVIYSEMSYNPITDAWKVFGRDETTGESSTYMIKHPIEDPARSWKEVQADPKTSASPLAVSEPHQVSDPTSQMPPTRDFRITVGRPMSALTWSGYAGSAKVVSHGGAACSDDRSVTISECQSFAASGCARDITWCRLCAETCGAAGATCGCQPSNPPVWTPTVVSIDLQWKQ